MCTREAAGDVPEVGEQAVRGVDHRVAPARAATGPARHGGRGVRCAATMATGERKPRRSTAIPAADQPSCPQTATTSPARAPDRVTAARPSRSRAP